MAILNFNPPPPRFISQPLLCDRKTLIPTITIASVGNRLIFPPLRLPFDSQRKRDLHVPNIFKDRRRRGNVLGVRELNLRNEEMDSDYEDEEEEDDDDEEEEEEEVRDVDEDEVSDDVFVLGLGSKMQKWFENRPSGFGEGKVYDTSIEDKLLEEMRQSQIAQAININRLKHSRGNGDDNAAGKKLKKKKNEVPGDEDEVVPTGVQVQLGNLPKKKNILRDLNLAFKGFVGISSIVPAVKGNKKTRDPVCLGFAHVYLESEQAALRFVRTFSRQTLTFGRVQKQISCEMTNPHMEISAHEITHENPEVVSQLALPEVVEYPHLSGLAENDDVFEAVFQQTDKNSEYFTVLDSGDVEDDARSSMAHPSSSASNRQKKAVGRTKPRAKARPSKVPPAKVKSGKFLRVEVPGSAKRLKIKEKTVLTGVLSKYQAMAVSVTSDS